jgi:hypothetical protein
MSLKEQTDLKEKKVTDKTLVAPVENSDPCCMPDCCDNSSSK